MHVVVIDPGFEDLHSHHANVNEGIYASINSTEKSSLVTLAAKKLHQTTEAALLPDGALPFFSSPCYINRLNPLDKEREQQLAEAFAGELDEALIQGYIKTRSILVLHTFFSFHLLGLAIWLVRNETKFRGGIVLCGMFYPGTEMLTSVDNDIEFRRYMRFKLAADYLTHSFTEKNRLVVATSCIDFVASYEKLFKQKVMIHPIVTRNQDLPDIPAETDKPKSVLLYAGSIKQNKGLGFILDKAEELLLAFPSVEFIFHLNTFSPGIRDFQQAESLLKTLLNKYSNLICHFGYLSNAEYQHLLNQANAMVCHYEPEAYNHKTSGLLWDAMLRENMGLICTSPCWLAREYKAVGGKPFPFDYNDFGSLKETITTWLTCEGPFIHSNHYYESLVKSFPEWVKQHCINLHKIAKAG